MTGFWSLFRRRRKTALEAAWRKTRDEAVGWAKRSYPETHFHDTAARFVVVLESITSVPIHQFTLQTRFLEDLGMDELEPVELVMAIEEEFEIPAIAESEAERLCTVDETIRYVVRARCEKKT